MNYSTHYLLQDAIFRAHDGSEHAVVICRSRDLGKGVSERVPSDRVLFALELLTLLNGDEHAGTWGWRVPDRGWPLEAIPVGQGVGCSVGLVVAREARTGVYLPWHPCRKHPVMGLVVAVGTGGSRG